LYSSAEIIVVDNASNDNSKEIILDSFPEVTWISLKNNIGFGKACNVGAQNARGKYILFLNPDTLVSKNVLSVFIDFLEENTDIGIVGPKIIDQDGTFQMYSRRSFPKPFYSFVYLFGLSKIVPKNNKLFGRYNLTYLNPEESCEVDAISGSCMFMRNSLFKKIGGFDKDFFMFGEDLDLCAQCKEAGYKVWYNADTQIIHFKGKSSAKNIIQTRINFYRAMIIFSKKYRHTYGAFFPGWILTLGVLFKAVTNISMIFLKSSTASLLDLFFVNGILWIVMTIRMNLIGAVNPYSEDNILRMTLMHLLISLCFLLSNAFRGIYSSERYSSKNTLISGSIASVLFLSGVFFIKSIAFSRIAFAISAILISVVLVGWRIFLPLIMGRLKQRIYSTGNVIILGNNHVASTVIKNIEDDKTAKIVGIILSNTDSNKIQGEFEGYPVLGIIDNTLDIFKKQNADLLIIASKEPWYSVVIEMLTFLQLKNLTIKWVSPEYFKKMNEEIPEIIPLNDFSI
jgi:GT2 family glycosyltransferase